MDSEDSRDESSASDSDREEKGEPRSQRESPKSGSRNGPSSQSSASRSPSPESGAESTKKARSRSSSSESPIRDNSQSRSRPFTPKSPLGSASNQSAPNSPSDFTINHPKSPQSEESDGNKVPKHVHSRSSSHNSSRSSSPGPKSVGSDDDNKSIKSDSTGSTKQSKSRSSSRTTSSRNSKSSKNERKPNDDGNTSDSSNSTIDSSSRKNKNLRPCDTMPEEISDGDMESDQEKTGHVAKEVVKDPPRDINISHEDLSDVSELEDSLEIRSDDEIKKHIKKEKDLSASEPEDLPKGSETERKIPEKSNRPEEGEEQLDFEAEDGECGDAEVSKGPKEEQQVSKGDKANVEEGETVDEQSANEKEAEELEEGEVTDEDDVRPEETEPRPVCRFFSRGQCTWGASCRFLHPGVTDKGNYTMFELIRPVVPGEFVREDRIFGKSEAPQVESAWERGLRTAKEMLRKSIKRKEQDIDFEEKKMNLSLAQEEFDKENGYYGRVASPEPRYVRQIPPAEAYPIARPPSEEYYGRRQVVYEQEYIAPTRERVRSYRELPAHRMPDYYNNKYEEPVPVSKVRRPKREVIVQRVQEKQGRGDEWSDPWMRSKSPSRRKEGSEVARKRSYSSGSSYSSSSSSRSSSESSRSSYRSRSPSTRRQTARPSRGRQVSPSVIVSERKAANERAALMNPPAPRKRAASPTMMRVAAANPPAPSAKDEQIARSRSKLAVAAALARVKDRRNSSRSSSDSSGSSSSDSDSSGSSSSSSQEENSPPRRASGVDISIVKAMDALKSGSSDKRQIKLNLKAPMPEISRKMDSAIQGKKRLASSPPVGDSKSKKTTSRREELLKQLKAVEDAIAKKRSKVN